MSQPIVLRPGERVVDGKVLYSAAYLDARSALDRARAAWARRHDQMELPFHDEEKEEA